MIFLFILLSTFIVSAISLIGILTIFVKENFLQRIIFCLIGFSAGSLIGGAFLHILPEVLEKNQGIGVFYNFIFGIILFFSMERYFYWRHCHDGVCNVHAFTYLNLIGDGLHNFIDGLVIASSFMLSIKLCSQQTIKTA